MKNHFPFRLGTTSYILRDAIVPNVRFLADKLDHIELLLFETDEQSNYPSAAEIAELNAIASDHNLTYTVHLPIGIKLGSPDETRRRNDLAAVLRAIEATTALNPLAWDLHLEENPGQPLNEAWQDACLRSLEELKTAGIDHSRIGIENLEFDYAPILPLLEETGFPSTLDIGHVWHGNFDETFYLENVLPRAVSIHLHGFNEIRDHKSLHFLPPEKLKAFINRVARHPNAEHLPVSIEVFSENSFYPSLETLANL